MSAFTDYYSRVPEKRREEMRARARAWKAANRDRVREYRQRYWRANKPKERENFKSFHARNPAKKSGYDRTYRTKHPEKHLEYRRKNRRRINATLRRRYHSDENVKVRMCLRASFTQALRLGGAVKRASILKLLGCSIPEFKRYLGRKFRPGMSWENHGKWHIDHVRPCASFDLTDPEQQRRCFHFSNLQPLWAFENHVKGAKWTPENN